MIQDTFNFPSGLTSPHQQPCRLHDNRSRKGFCLSCNPKLADWIWIFRLDFSRNIKLKHWMTQTYFQYWDPIHSTACNVFLVVSPVRVLVVLDCVTSEMWMTRWMTFFSLVTESGKNVFEVWITFSPWNAAFPASTGGIRFTVCSLAVGHLWFIKLSHIPTVSLSMLSLTCLSLQFLSLLIIWRFL